MQRQTEELVSRAKAGSQQAFSELAVIYTPLIESECLKHKDKLDMDELKQAALIGLYSAVCAFDPGRGVTFGAFAKVCIANRINSELRRVRPAEEELDEELHGAGSPEDDIIERESYLDRLESIDAALTDYEKNVFLLYLNGESYKFIAARLGKTEKSVDGAIRRSKEKLRRFWDKELNK